MESATILTPPSTGLSGILLSIRACFPSEPYNTEVFSTETYINTLNVPPGLGHFRPQGHKLNKLLDYEYQMPRRMC